MHIVFFFNLVPVQNFEIHVLTIKKSSRLVNLETDPFYFLQMIIHLTIPCPDMLGYGIVIYVDDFKSISFHFINGTVTVLVH